MKMLFPFPSSPHPIHQNKILIKSIFKTWKYKEKEISRYFYSVGIRQAGCSNYNTEARNRGVLTELIVQMLETYSQQKENSKGYYQGKLFVTCNKST